MSTAEFHNAADRLRYSVRYRTECAIREYPEYLLLGNATVYTGSIVDIGHKAKTITKCDLAIT